MILINKTGGKILSKDLKQSVTIADKFLGLHKKTNPKSLIFKTRFGIHTFFLKEKIDVIILNGSNEVVKTKTVNTNSIFLYNPKYTTVIELPEGTIKSTRTKVGDILIFQK